MLKKLLKKEKDLNFKLRSLEGDLTGPTKLKKNSNSKHPKLARSSSQALVHRSKSKQFNKKKNGLPKFNISYSDYYRKVEDPDYEEYIEYKRDKKDWNRRKHMLFRYEVKMAAFNDGNMDCWLNNSSIVKPTDD